jgi:glycosyltransferase involved in cell wall biosynthesis
MSASDYLPGGIEIDAPMRAAVVEGLKEYLDGLAPAPPDPWSDGLSAFLKWLEAPSNSWRPGSSRYWDKVRAGRDDVTFAFPDPDGASAQAFREWCRNRFVTELSSPTLSAPPDPSELVDVPESGDQTPGVNVVGYLSKALGLGEVARTLSVQAKRHGLPIAAFPYWRSASTTEFEVNPPFRLPHKSNLVVITADQVRYLLAETPSSLWSDHFNVGYWFWEIEHVPDFFVSATSVFDEIWVATNFVRQVLGQVLDIPVRCVPLPVRSLWESPPFVDGCFPEPGPCRFLVTLDLNSVVARKNPAAAIDAFQLAFPAEISGGPSLLVKTMNGHLHPAELHKLIRRAARRSDIEVRDEVLSRSDQDALIASSSCLVSLHRSEGLGLHLAEAMALGVPVIATGYSGNLDFMNSSNSRLIDYELVDIDDAGPYTGCGKWAEPDVEAAAQAMRELEGDRQYRLQLSEAGLDSIRSYSQEAEKSLTVALQGLVARPLRKGVKR